MHTKRHESPTRRPRPFVAWLLPFLLATVLTAEARASAQEPSLLDQIAQFYEEQNPKTIEERGEKDDELISLLFFTYLGKVKWDGCWNLPTDANGDKTQGGKIALTTADCPSDNYPTVPDKHKKGWGEKQLIVFHKCWKKLLEDSTGASGYSCLVLLVSTFVHELVHVDQELCYPFPDKKKEAEAEKPAYCKQVEFLCEQLDNPPLSNDPTGQDAVVVKKFKEAKKKQKEEWCKHL